jgi:hypothetical protein
MKIHDKTEAARLSFLRLNPFCHECDRRGYVTLSRVYDALSSEALCLRCHGDLERERDEAEPGKATS